DLKLDKNSLFLPPICKKENLFQATVMAKKIPVILCPYATVTTCVSKDFFEQLAAQIQKMGIDVYTNVVGQQISIKNTIELRCSLKEIHALGNQGYTIIGLRSGLLDLLVYTYSKLIAIYPDEKSYNQFFSLKMLPETKAQFYELTVQSNIRETIDYILYLISTTSKEHI
ncbi:MAG: hypothetical protein LUH04_07945, partial [Clostridium sp.]|nr:hypothetical protein [Clostridium sp.]